MAFETNNFLKRWTKERLNNMMSFSGAKIEASPISPLILEESKRNFNKDSEHFFDERLRLGFITV